MSTTCSWSYRFPSPLSWSQGHSCFLTSQPAWCSCQSLVACQSHTPTTNKPITPTLRPSNPSKPEDTDWPRPLDQSLDPSCNCQPDDSPVRFADASHTPNTDQYQTQISHNQPPLFYPIENHNASMLKTPFLAQEMETRRIVFTSSVGQPQSNFNALQKNIDIIRVC